MKKYLFKNKINRWFTFEGVTLTFVRSGKFLLVTDLSNFFENIAREQIIAGLEKVVPEIEATGSEKLQSGMRSPPLTGFSHGGR